MSDPRDVTGYLSSLLVTDRQGLTFLYQTVVGRREATLEEMVGALTGHVQNNGGAVPAGLVHWLGAPGSLHARLLARVIRLAGYYRDESIAPSLRGILQQLAYVSVHPAAVRALSQVLGIRASGVLIQILWAAPPHQWHVRETAILQELGELRWSSAIDDLLKALGVPYDSPVRAAAAALARFDSDEVRPRLVSLVDGAATPRQAAGAAEALGLLGDPAAIVVLQRGAGGPNALVACACAVALARLGDPTAEERLVALAGRDQGHAGAEMRARAFAALGMLAEQDHTLEGSTHSAFVAGLGDSQPEVRSAAAIALAHGGRPGAAKAVGQALGREVSPLVRTSMIRALGSLGHSLSIPQLLEYLRSDTVAVKIEVLLALGQFPDPRLAQYIAPFRTSNDPRLVEAANRALRRLLHRPFVWPPSEATDDPVTIDVHALKEARNLLLPPPPPPPAPGFFEKLLGMAKEPEAPPAPVPIGSITLDAEGVSLDLDDGVGGRIEWARSFSTQVTREPVKDENEEDIGIHFTLRQRLGGAAQFETVAVSLWCAPSEAVGALTAKSERLPCLDPHQSSRFLAALRFYTEVHGERLPIA
jgi:HEAT repeat protein